MTTKIKMIPKSEVSKSKNFKLFEVNVRRD